MGVGGEKRPMREIDSTRANSYEDTFNLIFEKVEKMGGEIVSDQVSPFYLEVGNMEEEVGEMRVVDFSVNKKDFKLTMRKEMYVMSGSSRQKHLEELEVPRISVTLKIKAPYKDEWQNVDLEMFS